ncbi:MAG: hypothetical protein LIO58_07045, partial [Oscillospiraceae bacterium]|nr:hypothetical protein [Oscillospiraceae bacterium]
MKDFFKSLLIGIIVAILGLIFVFYTETGGSAGFVVPFGVYLTILICVCTGLILSKLNKKPDRQEGNETPRVLESDETDTKTDVQDDTD